MTTSRLGRLAVACCLGLAGSAAHAAGVGAAPLDDAGSTATDATESSELAARYVGISPIRVHDSRLGDHVPTENTTFAVSPLSDAVLAASGVDPDQVTAVVVNITALNATGPGFVTIYPHEAEQPKTSSVNFVSPTQVSANLATSRVGTDGRLDVFSRVAVDVIIDVQGVFVRSATATSGRHEPLDPRRVLDTRTERALEADVPRLVDVSSVGVPVDATAVVVTLAAVDTTGPGHFTAWPADVERPLASNLNFTSAGSTVSNGGIVAVSMGQFMLVSSTDADAIVDVTGYITGDGAPSTRAGLFVATEPHRIVDSRAATMVYARSTTPFTMTGHGPIPETGVASVALNITATSMERAGFVAALASGRRYDDSTSTVNVDVDTASSAAIVRLGAAGSGIGLYTSADTHVIVDVVGYFLGEADPDSDSRHLMPETPPIPPVDNTFTLLHDGRDLPAGYTGHVEWRGRNYVGWHPCRPIRYIVDDRLATPQALDVLDEAIATVEAATGFEFVRIGRAADLIFPEPRDLGAFSQPIDAELLIGFSTPAETPALAGSTKGFGGIGRHAPNFRLEGHTVFHDGGGLVAVDIAELTDRNTLRAVLLHELAHVVGLGHTADGAPEVMTDAVSSTPRTAFGLGDLNGLRLLGTAGCTR